MGRADRGGQGARARRGAYALAMSESLVPQDGRSTRPAVLRRLGGGVRGLLSWYNAIIGGQDYQRYVAHLERNHPGCPVPTEREYWRTRHADADTNPQNRCC